MKTIIRGWEIFVENSVCWNNSRVIIFLQGVRGERADSQRHKEADGREKGTIAATFVNDKNKMSHEHPWLLCPCPAPAALPSLSQWGYSPKFTKSIRYNKKRNELKQLNFNTFILFFCVFTSGMWMCSCLCANSARIADQGVLDIPVSISLVQRLRVCATKSGFVHGFWGSNSDHHTYMTASSLHSESFPKPLQCLPFPLHFSLVCPQVIEVVTS